MRREAAIAALGSVLTLGTACAGDSTLAPGARHPRRRRAGRAAAPAVAREAPDRRWHHRIANSCSRPTIRGTRTSRRSRSTPIRRRSSTVAAVRREKCTPDFGTVWDGAPNGIPYVLVGGTQPKVPVSFDYADESDPGPYPIPANAPIEGGPNVDRRPARHRDRHGSVEALRDVRCASAERRHELARRLRRDVEPELERAASRWLDVGRRRRTADLPWPRALRRSGHRRARSTTRCASRARRRGRHTSRPRATGRARKRARATCPWACASGSRRTSTSRRIRRKCG